MEAWFGISTVAFLAQPSGVGESSGNEGSGDTWIVQRWYWLGGGQRPVAPSFGTPPLPRRRLLGSQAHQILQRGSREALREVVWGEGAGEGGLGLGRGAQRRREAWAWT